MKHTLLTLLLATSLPLLAADKPETHADPFAGAFFPPEMILQARDQIGLTQQQQEAFQDRVGKVQSRSEELRVKLEHETAALTALAKQERADEAAVISQLDKVLDAERELKHLHIGLMVAIKTLLTPDQQAKLRELAKGGGAQFAEAARKRLTEKMERVKGGAQKFAESGRDPSEILRTMEEKFKPLIEAGKAVEAEAELDRVLELLKSDAK